MLNVRYLRVFRAIVKSGSVSGAARSLNVTQPAVTKSLRMLEDDLGIALFERVNGRLVITPEAQRLAPEVERLFGVLSGIKGLAEELREGHAGSMTIAAVTTLSLSLVSKAIEHFSLEYPNVRFELKALSTTLAAQHVLTNHVDMGVLDAPAALSGMEVIPLCRSEVGCVMKRDHPLGSKRYIRPTDLQDVPIITFGDDTFTGVNIRNAFYAANTPLKLQCSLNNTMMAYGLVRRGLGVALVDSFPILSGDFDDLTIRAFRPVIATQPSIVFSQTKAVPLVARAFARALVETTEEMIQDRRSLLRKVQGE